MRSFGPRTEGGERVGSAKGGAGHDGRDWSHDTDERRRNAIALMDADLRALLQVKEVEEDDRESTMAPESLSGTRQRPSPVWQVCHGH